MEFFSIAETTCYCGNHFKVVCLISQHSELESEPSGPIGLVRWNQMSPEEAERASIHPALVSYLGKKCAVYSGQTCYFTGRWTQFFSLSLSLFWVTSHKFFWNISNVCETEFLTFLLAFYTRDLYSFCMTDGAVKQRSSKVNSLANAITSFSCGMWAHKMMMMMRQRNLQPISTIKKTRWTSQCYPSPCFSPIWKTSATLSAPLAEESRVNRKPTIQVRAAFHAPNTSLSSSLRKAILRNVNYCRRFYNERLQDIFVSNT